MTYHLAFVPWSKMPRSKVYGIHALSHPSIRLSTKTATLLLPTVRLRHHKREGILQLRPRRYLMRPTLAMLHHMVEMPLLVHFSVLTCPHSSTPVSQAAGPSSTSRAKNTKIRYRRSAEEHVFVPHAYHVRIHRPLGANEGCAQHPCR